jgi:hypothetical protein
LAAGAGTASGVESDAKVPGKSKDFVVGKIIERIPAKIPEQKLKEQISELLFERDYNTIRETIAEYKKK